jgi:hypothetical protein
MHTCSVPLKERDGFAYHTASIYKPQSNKRLIYSTSSSHRIYRSKGILTFCPSSSALAIPLGPTNPTLITMTLETLIFRRRGISPSCGYLCQHSYFAHAPLWVTPLASTQSANTLLPLMNFMKNTILFCLDKYRLQIVHVFHEMSQALSFGTMLSPDYLRRKISR